MQTSNSDLMKMNAFLIYSMKYTVLSLLISIAALLTINYVTYKLVPAKISAIHRKSKWKYKANSSKNSLKTEFRIALFSLNSSSATSKNAKLRTSTEAINTFRCSDNVVIYFPFLFRKKKKKRFT